jgi:carbon monoxide dehydrogenase subunit G
VIEVAGQRTLDRPSSEVWRRLMDPAALRAAIPGCEEFEAIAPGRYRIALKAGMGFLKGRFAGEAALEEVVEPESYRIAIQVKGKLGWIEGATDVRLAPGEGGSQSRVTYLLQAKVGGVIAASARLLPAAARAWVEEFLDRLGRAV